MPAGMPTRNAITIAIEASWIVTGSFCAISSRTGTLLRKRLAEIARQHALDPVDVLDRHRLIEPILLADLLDHFGIALLARHDQRGIAGQKLLQREDQHRHEEQCRDELDQPPCEEVQHGRSLVDGYRSLQLQPDHAHQSVGHLLVAFELRRVRDQDAAVIEVEQGLVLQHMLGELFIDRLALGLVGDEPGIARAPCRHPRWPSRSNSAARPCA